MGEPDKRGSGRADGATPNPTPPLLGARRISLTIPVPLGYNERTVAPTTGLHEYALAPLWDLLALDSPSGDEGPLADWLETYLAREVPGCPASNASVTR